MGILPSRESHEYPGAFHFAQSGSHAMAILPLTEHFFPSVDSLAFKQLYAGREMQSAKYNFSLMSPELLRRYRRRAMEQRCVKEEAGEGARVPPTGRRKPQPYLRHGEPPGDGSDTNGEWVGVDTIDASNYSQFFRDDTQCVSPNSPALPSPDGDEEVCEELQRPNPSAHWHTHDATKQLIQDEDNQTGLAEELNYVSLDGKGGGLRCLPSSPSVSSSSASHLRLGQARHASTKAAAAADTDAVTLTAPVTAEERDVLNRFFARSPEALYNALVVEPNKGFLVDTNKEMCKLYAAERRWKEARNVVRAYRRQCKQGAAASEAAQPASGTPSESLKDPPQRRITKEEADEAAKVPPPPMFLRPVPQVIMVRMSREEEEATRAAYLAEQQRRRTGAAPSQQSRHGDGDDIAPSMSSSVAAAGADEGSSLLRSPTPSSLSPLHVPTSRYHRFEDDPKYKDGRIHLVEEDGVLYMFAYNTAYVDPRERVRRQREELLKQQQERDRLKQQAGHEGSPGSGEASGSPSSAPATATSTAAEAATVSTTAASLDPPTTERGAAATLQTHSSGGDDDGALCHMSRQTSSFYHTVSSFGKEEDEAGSKENASQLRRAKEARYRHVSATVDSPVAAGAATGATVAQVEGTEEEEEADVNNNGDGKGEGAAASSASRGWRGCQRQQDTTGLADDAASLQRSDGKPSTSSEAEDDEEEDGDAQREGTPNSAPLPGTDAATASGTAAAAAKERQSRVVQQLELVTAAPFILPICPVRVVGCNGYAESRCRGTPWLRGYEDDPEEDAYVESLPVKPPIMSGGGFIDANIGDKILSRAYLLGFQVYRNVCFDAGLPETLTRPFWTLGLLSNIPLLQISREMRFRMRAAAAEVDLGYRGLRDMIKGTENDLQSYIYGFSDILPYLERASRARVEQAEAEAKAAVTAAAAATAATGGDGDAAALGGSLLLPAGRSAAEKVDEAGQQLPSRPVSLAIPTRSSQAAVQHNLLFPRTEMEFYTQLTIRGSQSLSRVRCEAQESFFHLIAEATAPVSTSLFMKPLELSMYDYGGAIRLHLMRNRVTGADELQVLPPPRNLQQLHSDHQRRLQLRRQPRAAADNKKKPKPNVKGGREGTADDDAAPPYLVYAVVHPSSKARGPSLEHHKRNLQAPEDGADAYTLDEAEAAAAATDGGGTYAAHQYMYPSGSFVDSDMVIYNLHRGRWEHFEYFHQQQLAQRRQRTPPAQEEKAAGGPEKGKQPVESRNDTADVAALKRAAECSEACQNASLTSGGGGFDVDAEDVQDIHLEDILLCWIKRRLQSATMRNRSDPGWLRDSAGHIVQEGRYYIWGFEQDSQHYFYGLIPKFSKEKHKRHHASGSNAQNQPQHDSRTRRSSAHGTLSGPTSALSAQHRSKVGSSSSGAGTPSAYRISPNKCIVGALEQGHLSADGNGSACDRQGTSPGTRSPASECSPTSSAMNGQAAGESDGGKTEWKEVRSGPASARDGAENCRARVPTSTAVTPSASMSDLDACGGSGGDTRTDVPLNVAYADSLSKRQQQHPRSAGAAGRGGGSGLTSPGSGAATAAAGSTNRSSNPRHNNGGARLPAHTSGAPRSGARQKSPPPTPSSASSPVTTSATTPPVLYNTPVISSRCAAASREAASPSLSSSAAVGTQKGSEAALVEGSAAAAVERSGPSHPDPAPSQSPPSSVASGGMGTETGASLSNPRALPHHYGSVSHTNSKNAVSREQQCSTSASTAAKHNRQSTTAPADSAGYSQGRRERRGKAAEWSRTSAQPQQCHQQGEPRSSNVSPPQQQQQGRHITDPGAAVLGYKGAPQSRCHVPQYEFMEYMQAPPSATCDRISHSDQSGAYHYPTALHASGPSYSDTPLPPPSSSPPPPALTSGVESAVYEQSCHGCPSPAQLQRHPSSSPPPHLHPPTVCIDTGAAQTNVRPSSTPGGPRVPSPRHAQHQQVQRQPYASYSARPTQQQRHVSRQPYYKGQPVIASAVASAAVQHPELAPGPYHHHGPRQQPQTMAMSAPNAGPAAMNTSSSRHVSNLHIVASGSVLAPMQQQQQQQPTTLTAVSAAPSSALGGGNSTYADVSAASMAPSGLRATSYHLTSPAPVSFGASSQAARATMQPAGLQANTAPPHTGPFSSTALPLQPKQTFPSSAITDSSAAGSKEGVASHGCPPYKQPPSPLSGTGTAAPANSRYGQMPSSTLQQHAYQQQMGPRNASYNGGSISHNNNTGSGGVTMSLPRGANPNANSGYSRLGLSLPAMAGGSGASVLMSNSSTPLLSAVGGNGRGAQGYTPPHSGYPASGSASVAPTPVAAMAEGATAPASSIMPGSEGSTANAYPQYRPSQPQQGQPSPQPLVEASAGGRAAGAPSAGPHPFGASSTARKQQQQQRNSRYSLQTMVQSSSNDYSNGGAPAMASGGRAWKGAAAVSDGADNMSYDDSMMHGGRGAHGAGGQFQLPYPQQHYQQPHPKWHQHQQQRQQQQHQHPSSASSQPSSSSPTPVPVQYHHQQYAAQAGSGSHNGSRGHAHAHASYAGATGAWIAGSAYACEQETEPRSPNAATAATPTSPVAAISSGSGQSAAAAAAVSVTVTHASPAMHCANSYNGTIATMKPAASSASTQAALAAAQQQRTSDSQGYRSSRSGPHSSYSQQQQEHQRHPRQQRLVTRATAASGPFHPGGGSETQPKAMITSGSPPAPASHAHTPHQQQQQGNTQPSPSLDGYDKLLTQQPAVPSQPLAPTPNASGTLLRVSPGLQERYSRQNQRQQQQQRKSLMPHTSPKGAAEPETRMVGSSHTQNTHSSSVGAAEGSFDLSSGTATQRFAHNPYAMS
ncbi:hypothetical protein LSCM1_07201 [Leishmania martiniquensis]|uniref:Uncharacterized protein n=1 Tax=Leishmania martiniquensis TaxID=1580590 RepID=A0A836H4N9_9TRYP|nr:hypothetical protein LSCM1_07201 [Leishmania martiniquensis]